MYKYLFLVVLLVLSACLKEPPKPKSIKVGDFYRYGLHVPEYRQRVVIVDSGLDPSKLSESYMCNDYSIVSLMEDEQNDTRGHGTNLVSIISKGMDTSRFCITMMRNLVSGPIARVSLIQSIDEVLNFSKVSIVNLSLQNLPFSYSNMQTFKTLTDRGVKVNVAAGNFGVDLNVACLIYPACYTMTIRSKNFNVIGVLDDYSNHGLPVTVYLPGGLMGTPSMQGTSQATALFTSFMVKKVD